MQRAIIATLRVWVGFRLHPDQKYRFDGSDSGTGNANVPGLDIMKALANSLAALLLMAFFVASAEARIEASYDVVVYGGSPSGLAAAIQAARMGSHVMVVEPLFSCELR